MKKKKKYSDFMDEITSDELYDGLVEYGLFSEKLPPIFDCTSFLKYCKDRGRKPDFPKEGYSYAEFYSMRHIHTPRTFGIPTPMAHARVCAVLSEYWKNIQDHFRETTKKNNYNVSRIHIRKMEGTNSLFKMSYNEQNIGPLFSRKERREDGDPEPDISLGKKYLVEADISNFFPSIYSHAIPWALDPGGKDSAKQRRGEDEWYNKIDVEVRNSTRQETHGILIGPHTSNILSEIILCRVDESLSSRWKYTRRIDDFRCYVNTKDEAEKFLVELNNSLKKYKLSLNHKKTRILELPLPEKKHWVHQIKDRTSFLKIKKYFSEIEQLSESSRRPKFNKIHPSEVNYTEVQAAFDFLIELMSENGNDAAILKYGIKAFKDHNLSEDAKEYIAKRATHLALIYPYLVPYLGEFIYDAHETAKSHRRKYINSIFHRYLSKEDFEAVAYALYYAVEYRIKICKFDIGKIIKEENKEEDKKEKEKEDKDKDKEEDCILLLCCLIYCRRHKLDKPLERLKERAKKIVEEGNMESYWPFVYECLLLEDLREIQESIPKVEKEAKKMESWIDLKENNVSFLKAKYRSKNRSKIGKATPVPRA